jgi:dethiobiotin synthetase
MKVAIVGVATEVGKTWASARLLERWRADGVRVAARKPVQSFDPADAAATDAEVLAAASGEPAAVVCPPHRSYRIAMAPPMASDRLGLPAFSAADLLGEIVWPADVDVVLVETVGGVRSPLADDADSAAFARLLAPDRALLVADAGLGTINAVRLSLGALTGIDTVVYLNRFDGASDLHRRNLEWLTARDGYTVATSIAELAAALRP